jgi:broad specificity phosphatase PhoE
MTTIETVGTLLLVRHARAGLRGTGPEDLDRPLDERGRAQAEALPELLRPFLAGPGTGITDGSATGPSADLLSSPARRCVETLAPLARALGRSVDVDDALVEGCEVHALLARIEQLRGPTVWASHGDVIPELLGLLARRGLDLGNDPRCAKGSTWVIGIAGGIARTARYLPPPA